MIRFFRESRSLALWGSIISGVLSFLLVWRFYEEAIGARLMLSLIVFALGINVVLYAAKMIAVRRYQELLLILYEQFDVETFLTQAEPLLMVKTGIADQITHAAHVANAYVAKGDGKKAIALLDQQLVPAGKPDLQGLVLSNKGTAYLHLEDRENAGKTIAELQALANRPGCREQLRKKFQKVIAYQQICLGILNGKVKGKELLEQDYESGKSMVHKMNTGKFLLKIYEQTGEREKAEGILKRK